MPNKIKPIRISSQYIEEITKDAVYDMNIPIKSSYRDIPYRELDAETQYILQKLDALENEAAENRMRLRNIEALLETNTAALEEAARALAAYRKAFDE